MTAARLLARRPLLRLLYREPIAIQSLARVTVLREVLSLREVDM